MDVGGGAPLLPATTWPATGVVAPPPTEPDPRGLSGTAALP